MLVYTAGHSYLYECEKIIRIFYPLEKISFEALSESVSDSDTDRLVSTSADVQNPDTDRLVSTSADVQNPDTDSLSSTSADVQNPDTDRLVFTSVEPQESVTVYSCRAEIDGKKAEYSFSAAPHSPDRGIPDGEKLLARAMVHVLSEITGIIPAWGILTGVRPSKLMRRLVDKTDDEASLRLFENEYLVQPEKALLALKVARAQKKAVSLNTPDSFSLYISVPFCPTRCSYCSFVSHSIASAKKLIPDYVRLLCREIEASARLAREAGLKLETVYIGGGTPTSLGAEDLKTVTEAINRSFDMASVREFTVEAGRPDTIDREKLLILKNAGVTRVSINPQTFSDEVLRRVGRPHTGQDAVDKYLLAREVGFDSINMDFIAGLPGDSFESFRESIEKAVSLAPENITVHTLALKRSASLVTEHETDLVCFDTLRMTEFSQRLLTESGYLPYYMYRQSKSVGNLENIGWCKENTECLYNIYMMEELHSVVACGGGAVTKLTSFGGEKVERIYNFKYPYEYINRFDEQLDRKQKSGLRIMPENP